MTQKPFFKRIVFFSVFLTFSLLANLPFINAADYEWNKQIPLKKPAPETDNGKLVLFDNSHMSTVGQADWVIDGAFSDFADALVNEGYTVKEYRGVDKNREGIFTFFDDRKPENVDKNECIITFEAIKEADVFILAESNRPFRLDKYAALKKFIDSCMDDNKNVKIAVKSGGGIKLVLYDQYGKRKKDLPGSYEVKDNTATAIH